MSAPVEWPHGDCPLRTFDEGTVHGGQYPGLCRIETQHDRSPAAWPRYVRRVANYSTDGRSAFLVTVDDRVEEIPMKMHSLMCLCCAAMALCSPILAGEFEQQIVLGVPEEVVELKAEGFGAASKGGEGGEVLWVTNLNDSGPGSLREALKTRGPAIIRFKVGGVIKLQDAIRPNGGAGVKGLTLDGLSAAPYGGITEATSGAEPLAWQGSDWACTLPARRSTYRASPLTGHQSLRNPPWTRTSSSSSVPAPSLGTTRTSVWWTRSAT